MQVKGLLIFKGNPGSEKYFEKVKFRLFDSAPGTDLLAENILFLGHSGQVHKTSRDELANDPKK